MPLGTFLDVVKFKGLDGRDIIAEIFRSNPAFTGVDIMGNKIPIASRTIDEDRFEAMYKIGNPDVDPFRVYNMGFGTSQGSYERRQFQTTIAGQFYDVDAALVDNNPVSGSQYLALRAADILEATISAMERQFFYGGQNDNATTSKLGFQGLQVLVDDEMVYDAEGENNLTTAYLVNFNDRNGVTWIFGKNGTMEFSDPQRRLDIKTDPAKPNEVKKMPIIEAHFEFYPGVAYLSKYAASKVVNIDTSTAYTQSKNPYALTDEMLATAIAKWPVGAPNAILMTKAAGMMLAASRTITTLVGAGEEGTNLPIKSGFVSLPKDHNGIPIAYTDALLNDEKEVEVIAA
jgi:hypothetical protein